jgi:hypothetical protein
MARLVTDAGETLQVAGIRELVEVDDRRAFGCEPAQNEVRADEAGSARNENQGRRMIGAAAGGSGRDRARRVLVFTGR